MKVGDLVRQKDDGWIGIVTGFRRGHAPSNSTKDYRYAVVMWSNAYPKEEEYLQHIEVISESR